MGFVTFNVTLPYPSLDAICLYLIVGGIATAGILLYLLVTANHEHRSAHQDYKELAVGIAVFMFGWPFVLYLFLKENAKQWN